jgi:penicillin amidase
LWFLLAHSWSAYEVLGVLSHPSQDVFGAEPEKGRNRLMEQSFDRAVERLRKLEGPDSAKWTWGQLHYMQFRHSLSPIVPDLGPLPRSGDGQTVGATGHYGDSFEQVTGASYREILDLNDWDNSVAVNTPGQSGEPGSRHYSDLMRLWNEGKYFPLLYSDDQVERVVTDRLELHP